MKISKIFFIITCSILMLSCQHLDSSNQVNNDIPKLLLRPHIIGPVEEMGHTLDMYNKIVGKITSNPTDIESRLSLVELFMQEARISGEHGYYYPAALTLIDAVMEMHPQDPIQYRALLDKASVLLSLHQFPEAKMMGEQALALNAHSADAYGVLVDAHVELGEYDKAVELADKMVSIRPDLRSYSRVSYLREIYGKVDGAKEALKLAVAAGYPGMEQTEWARLTLGHLYERYGSLDSAMMQYSLALSVRPNYPFAIAAMANTYATMGQNVKADSLNKVAQNLIPEVSFFIHQATWEKARGNTQKAKDMSKEILVMMSEDEKAGHKMGLEVSKVYLDLLNDADKALTYALAEYKVRPENIDINKMLAEIYFFKGELAQAQVHLTKALRTGSKDPETKCLEGMLLSKNDQKIEGANLIKAVFVEIPYFDCNFCKEARSIIL